MFRIFSAGLKFFINKLSAATPLGVRLVVTMHTTCCWIFRINRRISARVNWGKGLLQYEPSTHWYEGSPSTRQQTRFYHGFLQKRPAVYTGGHLYLVFIRLYLEIYSYIGECVISYHIANIALLIHSATVDKRTCWSFLIISASAKKILFQWKNCYY